MTSAQKEALLMLKALLSLCACAPCVHVQARFQSLDDELPLKDAKAYDEVAFGLHANEVDAGIRPSISLSI
jgi:hypothetical protein